MPSPPPGYVGFLGRLRITKELPEHSSFVHADSGAQVCFEHSISRFSYHTVATSWPLAYFMRPPATYYTLCLCNQVRLRRFLLTVFRQIFASPLGGFLHCDRFHLIDFPSIRSHLPFETFLLRAGGNLSATAGSDQFATPLPSKTTTPHRESAKSALTADKHGARQHKQLAQP